MESPILPLVVAVGSRPSPSMKPAVEESSLNHGQVLRGPFWQKIPAYSQVSEAEFLDHKWQSKHSITNPEKLLGLLKGLTPEEFHRDAAEGFRRAPMSVRVSP